MSDDFGVGDVFLDQDRRIIKGQLPTRTLEVRQIFVNEKGKRSAQVVCYETGRNSHIRGARLMNDRYYKRIKKG